LVNKFKNKSFVYQKIYDNLFYYFQNKYLIQYFVSFIFRANIEMISLEKLLWEWVEWNGKLTTVGRAPQHPRTPLYQNRLSSYYNVSNIFKNYFFFYVLMS